jgi:hypothetical protein
MPPNGTLPAALDCSKHRLWLMGNAHEDFGLSYRKQQSCGTD